MDSPFLDWGAIPERTVVPGYRARFAHTERMTFALWNVDAGAMLPAHAHPHEQVVQVRQGAFELTIESETVVLRPDSIAVIAPNRTHSGRALTDCRILDVFSPVREDYRDSSLASVLAVALDSSQDVDR